MADHGSGDLLSSLKKSESAKEKWRNSLIGTQVHLGHQISEHIERLVTEAGKPHVPTNKGVELVLMTLNQMLRSSDPEISSKVLRALGIDKLPDR